MLKIGKEKLSLFLALTFVLFSFPLTVMAEEVTAPQGKGEIIEYEFNPDTLQASNLSIENQGYTKGESLGIFQLVGYSGDGMTYSGAKTQAKHTIAADLTVLPLGTKIFIGDTVYTVEDIGSGVKGKMVDIYFDTMAEASALTRKGRVYEEVFVAVPKQ